MAKRNKFFLQDSKCEILLTEKEVAEYLNVSRSFLAKGRMEGTDKTPSFVKIGRSVRYRMSEIDSWLERHIRVNTLFV